MAFRFEGEGGYTRLQTLKRAVRFMGESVPRKVGRARVACAAVLLAFFPAACDEAPQPAETREPVRVPAVRTMVLEPREWTRTIEAFGVVEPAEEVDLTTDFAGTVRAVRFREGYPVEAGAPLITFDPRKRALRLQEAEAQVRDARALLTEAQDAFERRRALVAKNAVSVETYREAEARLESARAQVEHALAARDLARRELEETTLISPVSGVVVRKSVDPGETILPGTVLGVVQTSGTVRVLTHVTEKDVNALRVGATAAITTPGVRGRLYEGRIESVGFKADPRTGNFPVKLTVSNEDGLLRDGMTARVTLQGLASPDVLLVPREAIVDRNLRHVVYTVVDGRAREVKPIFAAVTGDALPVLDGLSAGDELIVDGLDNVSDGAALRVLEGP